MTSKVKSIIFLLLTISIMFSGDADGQIAVVVNGENPIDSLTTVQLRRIYLFDTTTWDFGEGTRVDITVIDARERRQLPRSFIRS